MRVVAHLCPIRREYFLKTNPQRAFLPPATESIEFVFYLNLFRSFSINSRRSLEQLPAD